MCTRDREFAIHGINDCKARGYDRTEFFEVDTGDAKDWTVPLTETSKTKTAARVQQDKVTELETTAAELESTATELYQARKFAEAIPPAQRALAFREKAQGPEHREVATTLMETGQCWYNAGRYPEARRCCERALAIREALFGPDAGVLSELLATLGMAETKLADYSSARLHLERAVAIAERTHGPEHAARLFAEQLSLRHDVDVLTTCAADSPATRNAYPEGSDRVVVVFAGFVIRRPVL